MKSYACRTLPKKVLFLAVASLLASAGAHAQSTTSTIYGKVPAEAGESIVVRNATGLTRTVSVDGQGRYVAPQLPVGVYTVSLLQDGKVVQSRDNVALKVGIGSEVSFSAAAAAANARDLAGVHVSANTLPPIDVSSVDSRTVVTAEQLAKLPLARSAEAAALLAPGASAGAGGATGITGNSLVSFGGSSSTENAYYINGFNSVDPYNSSGGLTLPYGSIDQEEVYTGGYSAQYGRSDGGVINMVGKSGTNEWHFGGQMLYQPEWGYADARDTYYKNGVPPGSTAKGSLYWPYSKNQQWQTTYDAYIGGPLIKDRLFLFASTEMVRQLGNSVASAETGTNTHYTYHMPKWYAKVNWNITDSNLLEVTGASNKRETAGTIYNYDYVNLHDKDFKSYANDTKTGGDMWTAKYTSYLTDSLTFTAQYGKMKTLNYSQPVGYDADLYYVGNTFNENPAYTGGTPIVNNQTVSSLSNPDKNYKTSNLRLSLTYTIGSHTITAGIDNLRSSANSQNSVSPGGYTWSYGLTDDPQAPLSSTLGVGAPANYPNGAGGYYVTKNVSSSGANLLSVQHAQYIEDQWQVSDRWLLSLGLRNDSFTNYNASGGAYMAQTKPQWAPRLGFSWDVNGDSSFKVFGNVGRYYLGLPLAPGGAANGYVSTTQYFTYSGIAADGTPTGLTAMSGPVSANNAYGQSPDPRTVTAHNIKAQDQDEYMLGFTKTAGSSWVYGAKLTRRILRHVLDDYCDVGRVVDKAASMGIDDVNDATCYYINPGIANTFAVADENGVYHNVTLSNAEMGNPHAKRKYYSLETYLEHPFDGHWYGKIDYVFSRLYGNTEGQGQSDIRATGGIQNEDWDFPTLMYYANGPQGNDHTNAIKAFGYYQITPEWLVSANLQLISGGPKYCLGLYGADPTDTSTNDPSGYHSNYHWCNGEPSPPGKNGRLPWMKQLDLGVQYHPAFAAHRLGFSLDVLNVTNSQVATNLNSQMYRDATGKSLQYLYGTPAVLQAPRYVRFGVTYDY